MGFNIAGLIIKNKFENKQEIENILNSNLKYSKDIDFEEATSAFREDNTIDILETEYGTLIFMELGQIYDLTNTSNEIIQFMISDVSDTYYFEKYLAGKLQRKLITSQGEVAEDEGAGFVSEEDDLTDKIWEFTDDYLNNNFSENMFDLKFKQYQVK